MAALGSRNLSSPEKNEAPSFFGDYESKFSGLSEPDMAGFVSTRTQTQADVPRGADSSFDPQAGEAQRQVRLPESFVLSDVAASRVTSTPEARDPSRRHHSPSTDMTAMVSAVCNIPLFTAKMVGSLYFDAAKVLEMATDPCRTTDKSHHQPHGFVPVSGMS